MSNKEFVNGVPRELLESALKTIHGLQPGRFTVEHDLRALLAQPVDDEQAEQQPAGEIILFGGDSDLKEVSWRKGKMPEVGTKLYAAPIAQAEQKPVAFVNFHEMEACLHKPSSGEWIPVYTAPIAQAAPRPTGLSKGWNLTRQHDGFVIGHSSKEPSEKDKKQAILDGRVYVPFLVAQAAPQPEQSGLVEALDESQSLLVAMLHEQRPASEIESQVIANRDALSAQGGE